MEHGLRGIGGTETVGWVEMREERVRFVTARLGRTGSFRHGAFGGNGFVSCVGLRSMGSFRRADSGAMGSFRNARNERRNHLQQQSFERPTPLNGRLAIRLTEGGLSLNELFGCADGCAVRCARWCAVRCASGAPLGALPSAPWCASGAPLGARWREQGSMISGCQRGRPEPTAQGRGKRDRQILHDNIIENGGRGSHSKWGIWHGHHEWPVQSRWRAPGFAPAPGHVSLCLTFPRPPVALPGHPVAFSARHAICGPFL